LAVNFQFSVIDTYTGLCSFGGMKTLYRWEVVLSLKVYEE